MDKYKRRFWSKVDKGTEDECWEWGAGCFSSGYGEFWNGEEDILSHRYAWEIIHGEIPNGMCVLHHCDNPKCVNPNHLFLGTNAANVRDRDKKDRQPKGEDHGRSKLTKEQVLEIRERYATENIMQIELAEEYNVTNQQISRIVNRKYWKHV